MADPPQTQIVIPSTLDQLRPVQERLISEAREAGFSDQAEFGLRLALDEALNNAIRHGNGLDPQKRVTISYSINHERLEISICDEGPGFDLEHVADPTLDENLACPEGRGVLLMRAYMTEVRFNDSGSCVTLIRDREDPPPTSGPGEG